MRARAAASSSSSRSTSATRPLARAVPCTNIVRTGCPACAGHDEQWWLRSGGPMTRLLALLLTLVAFGARVTAVHAQDYPQRTVTFVCPFPAGGGTDILTRML